MAPTDRESRNEPRNTPASEPSPRTDSAPDGGAGARDLRNPESPWVDDEVYRESLYGEGRVDEMTRCDVERGNAPRRFYTPEAID